MLAEGEAHRHVVLDDLLALGHRGQESDGLHDSFPVHVAAEEREWLVGGKRAGIPERLAPGEPEGGEGVGLGEGAKQPRLEARATPDILDRAVAVAARSRMS